MSDNRNPMRVSNNFYNKMKQLQKEIMKKQGENKSFKKIQDEIIKFPEWNIIEKKIIGNVKQIDFKINFDGRRLL